MTNRLVNIIAALFLVFVFLIAFFSMKDDSATFDEVAHLPAGYSYLTQKDMRLNPEHPPLIKDLAAFPLLFIDGINFPSEIKDWQEDVNGQWGFGSNFLYRAGNPADKMIFWGKIPMILILVLLGFYIFKATKELFGTKAALLSLFFFSFSPTLLAHGRLVTTDVGAAAGVFIATYYFLKFLNKPNRKSIVLSGIAFGLAELCKFSVILLLPFFAVLVLSWTIAKSENYKNFFKLFIRYCFFFLIVLIIGFVLIWSVYFYHTLNYPTEKQAQDIETMLSSHPNKSLGPGIAYLSQNPVTKPLAQYLLGLILVFQRASGSHTTYFLGEVSGAGWKTYFPTVYSIKEPLAFHLLTIIALLFATYSIKKPFFKNPFSRIKEWLKLHFPEFAIILFIVIYWAVSLKSNLNLGVRHLLPTFPFVMVLVSVLIVKLLKEPHLKFKYLILGLFISWQAISVIAIFPHFLSYFNELAGGPDNGYLYTVDSNFDWGQDLKRLRDWVNKEEIEEIYLDYFGGGDAKYYLKDKYQPWWGTKNKNELPKGSYLAISATLLQGGRAEPGPGFNTPCDYYRWLDAYQPITKIGYSIFVYYIE